MNRHAIHIRSEHPPVVELDSEARAAYVRFSDHPVARTEPLLTDNCIVTVDFDAAGEVVGVELVGVAEFGVKTLLEKAGIPPLPEKLAEGARYVPANLQST